MITAIYEFIDGPESEQEFETIDAIRNHFAGSEGLLEFVDFYNDDGELLAIDLF